MFENVIVEVSVIVDFVDELIDAGRRLSSAALERLGADNLAVVHSQFLGEGRC
jgi:hypothetical protein